MRSIKPEYVPILALKRSKMDGKVEGLLLETGN
jgi:hypothetical protein